MLLFWHSQIQFRRILRLPSSSSPPQILATHVTLFSCSNSTICAAVLYVASPERSASHQEGGTGVVEQQSQTQTSRRSHGSVTAGSKDKAGDKAGEQEC